MEYVFHILYRPEPEGGYTAIAPSLPGCVTYGKTLPKAQAMMKDAVALYVDSLKAHREPVPNDELALTSSIRMRPRLPAGRAPKRRSHYASKATAKVA
jgi:predicted RNase H-like HicB family nuclease